MINKCRVDNLKNNEKEYIYIVVQQVGQKPVRVDIFVAYDDQKYNVKINNHLQLAAPELGAGCGLQIKYAAHKLGCRFDVTCDSLNSSGYRHVKLVGQKILACNKRSLAWKL